jgi:hypothetical protein
MSLTDSHKSVFEKLLNAEGTLLSHFNKLKPADDGKKFKFCDQYAGLLHRWLRLHEVVNI